MVTVALSSITKTEKQLVPINRQVDKENVVYRTYTVGYYSALEKGNSAICDNMDEPSQHLSRTFCVLRLF